MNRSHAPVAFQRLACALLLLGALASPAQAQVRVVRGERIRASMDGATVIGTVVSMGDSSLVLRRERASTLDTIPFRSLGWVDVSRGRHARVWAIIAGGVVGLTLGGLVDGSTTLSSDDDAKPPSASGLPSLAGAAAGAWIGSRFKADRWTRASLPGSATLADAAPAPEIVDPRGPALGPFTAGSHVRYVLAGDERTQHTARVVRVSGDTLVLRPDGIGPTAVPLGAVRRFELSDGWHRHTGRGALIGGVLGAVGGMAIGAATIPESDDAGQAFANLFNGIGAMWLGFLTGTAVGVGGGALLGHAVYHEHWRSESLPLNAAVDSRGRVLLAVRLGSGGGR